MLLCQRNICTKCWYVNVTYTIFLKKEEENASPNFKILRFTVQMCNSYNRKWFPSENNLPKQILWN